MKKITKNNIEEFIKNYHFFHDSYIKKINYDYNNSKVEMHLDVYWQGNPDLKEDGSYETNKTKIKVLFTGIESFSDTEEYSSIDDTIVKCFQKNGKDLFTISFKSFEPNEKPYLSITCESIEYEEFE